MIALSEYLTVSALLFSIGLAGFFINRKNVLSLIMCLELLLLAASTNFIAFSSFLHNIEGQIMVLFILTVAAAEAAIGLSIFLLFFKKKRTIDVTQMKTLKG